jgi:hypothetical protein
VRSGARAVAYLALVILATGSIPGCHGTSGPAGGQSTSDTHGTAAPSASGLASVSVPERHAVETAIGDPVTADLCGALKEDPLSELMGPYPAYSAGPDPYQSFGTCTMDVKGSAGLVFQVEVAALDPMSFHVPRRGTMRRLLGVQVKSLPSTRDSCDRVVVADRVVIDVHAIAKLQGATSSVLCRAADMAVSDLAASITSGSIDRRSSGEPRSVTDLDLCTAARSALGRNGLPLKGAQVHGSSFGAACVATGNTFALSIDAALIFNGGGLENDAPVTYDGHRFVQGHFSSGCRLVSKQNTARDGQQIEIIRFRLTQSESTANVCQVLGDAASQILAALALN